MREKLSKDRKCDVNFPIAILGAGFSGIGTAIRLKKAGIQSFTIFERASQVGGTWRDNQYPGAACDVSSHVYSYSFEQNPNWSRGFSEAKEIQQYLLNLVEKWDLRRHLRLNAEVVSAHWDAGSGLWKLRLKQGEVVEARVIVSGVGGLVDPAYPDIKGLSRFSGEIFHTARWSEDIDLKDRRVAVIGTGASAVQVVPSIAPLVEKLSVFQRTPAWVMPKPDKIYSDREKRLLARFPFLLRMSRFIKYWMSEIFGPIVFLDSKRLSALGETASRKHLRKQVQDAELRAKLLPNFQFGCKRVLISNDYWRSFNRSNVELVVDPIGEITGAGVHTKDGRLHAVDAIVLATGFALGLATAPFKIEGKDGLQLADAWKNGAEAYKGVTVAGFPNFFMLMGPNTGPGHTSVLVYVEAQIDYTIQAIRALMKKNWKSVDVKKQVMERYNQGLQRRMKYMVWSSGCNSWYLSEDGKNHALYPGYAAEYVLRIRKFRPSQYEVAYF